MCESTPFKIQCDLVLKMEEELNNMALKYLDKHHNNLYK